MFDRTAMRIGMVFGRFARMVCRMQPVSVSDMRVVGSLFVVPVFVVTGGFAVVGGGMLVMFSRFSMMFRSFVVFHRYPLSWRNVRKPATMPTPRDNSIEF
jgi:hypothetical protein